MDSLIKERLRVCEYSSVFWRIDQVGLLAGIGRKVREHSGDGIIGIADVPLGVALVAKSDAVAHAHGRSLTG